MREWLDLDVDIHSEWIDRVTLIETRRICMYEVCVEHENVWRWEDVDVIAQSEPISNLSLLSPLLAELVKLVQ